MIMDWNQGNIMSVDWNQNKMSEAWSQDNV
jgi:hypothetical protein